MSNNRKYLAFDIETVKIYPKGDQWQDHRPLGLACAAATAQDLPSPLTWFTTNPDGSIADAMSPQDTSALLRDLLLYTAQQGYTLLTWNGLGFDFDVLAEESDDPRLCGELALNHIDMMFQFFCRQGYPISLQTAAEGMNTQPKTEGLSGDLAPELWASGQRQQVVDYCAQDTRATLDLALECDRQGRIGWTSRSGRSNNLFLPAGWLTVAQARRIPPPDTSWMTDPIPREQFTNWLPS